jgi:MFS transporter, ACS family, aldohexuronate transporter
MAAAWSWSCLSAAIMPASLLITRAPLPWAIAFFSMALFGHQFWSTILQTLPTDLFPSWVVGSVAGLMGAVGSAGAMLFNLVVGHILTRYHTYSPTFLIAGLVYPFALLLIFLFIPKVEPVISPRLDPYSV